MLLCSTSSHFVIHQRRTVELKHVSQLVDGGLSVTILYGALYFLVLLDDLLVGNCQIILGSACATDHLYTGTDRRRYHSQILDDHVGGIG
jgi:hypothetical protein